MIKASYHDKGLVIDILTASFENNQSVNYIVKQGSTRLQHIKALMDYSFEVCYLFGAVYLNEEKTACALVLFPDKKKQNLTSTILDVKMILFSIGLKNIFKALDRESKIKKAYPENELMYYLWFIGVQPDQQQKQIGTRLLQSLITDSKTLSRNVFLETSTIRNLPWYQNLGFEIYKELDFGYKLYFLKTAQF